MDIYFAITRTTPLRISVYIFYLLICILSVLAFLEYPGQGSIYILFTIVSNILFYFGFRKNAILLDAFIGAFFWLGFWFKFSVRVAFLGGQFHESTGNFDGTGEAFDEALLAATCGLFGFLLASFIRERCIFNYPKKLTGVSLEGLFGFYQTNRKLVLALFFVLFTTAAIINAYYGIYQRGEIPRTVLPYGLSGVFTWLLFFGLASFSAVILHFELSLNNKPPYLVALLGLLETYFSNISLLSRGMVLNASALFYGVFRSLKLNSIRLSLRFFLILSILFMLLFGSSVLMVNYFRAGDNDHREISIVQPMKILILDRWVGIEGVMAVTSYPKLGWGLWVEALGESFSNNKTSYYDMNFITSPYINTDMTKHHYISLPGIIAFFFYPGSYLFLFGCIFAVGLAGAVIEVSVFKLGGMNIILCALMAQVVAYRFAHFGYVPKQSYLLFSTVYLNLFVIYFADKYFCYLKKYRGEN